jgi:hypothetical protein
MGMLQYESFTKMSNQDPSKVPMLYALYLVNSTSYEIIIHCWGNETHKKIPRDISL